jgi:dolichyl-phosphate beta-glucosyltransferase
MRSRLRVFALVGLIATAVDLGLLLLFRDASGLIVVDTVALGTAAALSYLLNRFITFRGVPNARWVRSPVSFALTAGLAGLVDVASLAVLDALGLGLAVAKLLAIAAAATVRWFFYRLILFNTVRRELAERRPRFDPPGELLLSVVVPAYNEAAAIGATVQQIADELAGSIDRRDFEVLVVDDGSSDDTAANARAAGARVLVQPENRGKGAAVRTGFIDASGRFVVFTDADLAYPPATILSVLQELEAGWDFVVGSRRHDETTTLVRARRLRELGGRAVNWLTHLVLLGHFRDTQCGIKGFRSDIGRMVFERTVIDGFAFDVELFLMAEQDHLSLREVPVSILNRTASSVRIVGDTTQLLRDLIRVRRRAGAGGYRPTHHQQPVLDGTLQEKK